MAIRRGGGALLQLAVFDERDEQLGDLLVELGPTALAKFLDDLPTLSCILDYIIYLYLYT